MFWSSVLERFNEGETLRAAVFASLDEFGDSVQCTAGKSDVPCGGKTHHAMLHVLGTLYPMNRGNWPADHPRLQPDIPGRPSPEWIAEKHPDLMRELLEGLADREREEQASHP